MKEGCPSTELLYKGPSKKEVLGNRSIPFYLEKANVIPGHKSYSRQSKENYRPISLLPIFGKILEKLIFDSMYEHFCNRGLTTPNQSGFRPNDSAINQLLAITHHINCAFAENPSKETKAVFLESRLVKSFR